MARLAAYVPFFLALCLTLARVVMLVTSGHNLYADEAQYYEWSRHLDWGYYSKPPVVAWLIALTTHFCGQTEPCIRLASPLLHLATSLLLFLSAKLLYNNRIALWVMLVYLTLPAVSFSSQLISTDPPLLFFWSLSLFFFVKSIQTDRWRWWIATGCAAGFGMLSKYTMLLFLPSALLFLCFTPRYRPSLYSPKFWLAVIITLLLYSPNIYWNYLHGFVSYHHTQDISRLDKPLLHPWGLLSFLAAQAVVFGPLLWGVLLVLIARIRREWKDDNSRLLLCFILPLLTLITLLAFLSKAEANWAAPVYSAASILVVAVLFRWQKSWLVYGSVVLHLLLILAFSLYTPTDSSYRWDLSYRLKGWQEMGQQLNQLSRRYPGAVPLFDDRKTMAEMLYYGGKAAANARKWNVDARIEDHYDLTRDAKEVPEGTNFLFISKLNTVTIMPDYFSHITRLEDIAIPLYPDYSLHYHVYYLEGFKGY